MLIYFDGNQTDSLQVVDDWQRFQEGVELLMRCSFNHFTYSWKYGYWSIVIHIRSVSLFQEGSDPRTLPMRRKFPKLQGRIDDIS